MYNYKIEVVILTYNRCTLLEQAIRSVLNQTVKTKLMVVDNHSSDGTRELVKKINAEGYDILFVERPSNGGWSGNFETAKRHITHPYVMLFHDDDILHPQYVEFALKAIIENPQIRIVTSCCKTFCDGILPVIERLNDVECRMFTRRSALAAYIYAAQVFDCQHAMAFSSTIYRREYLLSQTTFDSGFGKIADKPFVVNGIGDGEAALVCGPMVYYRIHGGSDTANSANPCTMGQVINWVSFFKNVITSDSACANLYYLCAGRTLMALRRFSYGTIGMLPLMWIALKKRLLGFSSVCIIFERFLHAIGMQCSGFFERKLLSELKRTYKSVTLATDGHHKEILAGF